MLETETGRVETHGLPPGCGNLKFKWSADQALIVNRGFVNSHDHVPTDICPQCSSFEDAQLNQAIFFCGPLATIGGETATTTSLTSAAHPAAAAIVCRMLGF
jgi:hypothetical protein